LRLEPLECRTLLDASLATQHIVLDPSGSASPSSSWFTPQEIRTAYGISSIKLGSLVGDGSGQTIAIIDAYDDPTILTDLQTFSSQFGLPGVNGSGEPTFEKLDEYGGTSQLPTAIKSTWSEEEALDVEWAHAIAPMANLVLIEAQTASYSDLIATAVNTARSLPGVSVVSMSWGGGEFYGEIEYDSYFTTPNGHQGVTFLASTGDLGSPGDYPAYSPNVVAVGGTSLTLNADSSYKSETAWSESGGGQSFVETEPNYQYWVQNPNSGERETPDVAFDADPTPGVAICDSCDFPSAPWVSIGGTSVGAPCWAGLVAIADQLRVSQNLGTLDGSSQTLFRLASLPAADFHDVVGGSNGGYTAVAGYDLVTGRGSPVANKLVPDLAAATGQATPTVTVTDLGGTYAGRPFPATASVAGVVSGLDSTPASSLEGVTPTLAYYAGTTAGGSALNGAPTAAGTYTVVASFAGSADYMAAQSAPRTFTIGQAKPTVTTTDLGGTFTGRPFPAAASVAGVVSGVDTTPASSLEGVTPTLVYYAGATAGGSALNGVPTAAGTYTVVASFAGSTDYMAAQSAPRTFTIGQATPTVTTTDLGGTYSGQPFPATASVAGVVSGVDTTPASSLEGVTPSLAYYAGTTAGGTALSGVPTAAGTYTIVASFAGSSDYMAAQSAPVTFTIGPAALTVTATDFGGTYTGQSFPAAATVEGTDGNTIPAGTLGGAAPTLTYYPGTSPSGNGSTTPPTAAGTYTVVASFAGIGDYAAAQSAPVTFTISPATLTVTANDQTRAYGAADPPLTVSFSGFVNGETLNTSGVAGSPALAGNDTAASPVGSYTITAGQGTLAAQNYSFTFVSGTLTVTPEVIAVDAVQSMDSLEASGNVEVTVGSGGQLTVNSTLVLDSAGSVNVLDGGTLTVPGIDSAADAVGLNLDGGILQASAGFSTTAPITAAASGATIDSNGNNLSLSGPIAGPGGVTVTGAGTVTLSGTNNYGGATAVQSGTLVVLGSQAMPAGMLLSIGADGSVVLGTPGSSELQALAPDVAAVAAVAAPAAAAVPLVAAAPVAAVVPAVAAPAAAAAPAVAVAPVVAVAPAVAADPGVKAEPHLPTQAWAWHPASHDARVVGGLPSSGWPASMVSHSNAAVADQSGGRPAVASAPQVAVSHTTASGEATDQALLLIARRPSRNAATRAGVPHRAVALFGLAPQTLDLLARAAAKWQ
jgi:autotransporter-associated beta strand protein